jgi:hypothetical protein
LTKTVKNRTDAFFKFLDIIRTFAYSKYTHRAFAALAASFASQNAQKVKKTLFE